MGHSILTPSSSTWTPLSTCQRLSPAAQPRSCAPAGRCGEGAGQGGPGKALSLLIILLAALRRPNPVSYLPQFVQFHICFQFPKADI